MADTTEQVEKPKKVVFDEDVKVDDIPDDPFSGMKKKKKSKKSSALDKLDELDKEAEGEGEVAPEDGEKKEKKKKKKFDLDAFEKELAEGEDKEISKSAGAEAEDEEANETVAIEGEDEGKTKSELAAEKEDWLNSDRDYTYHELLGRLYKKLYAKQPNLLTGGRKKYTLAPPIVQREGKKSVFVNIEEIYRKMHRERDHLVQYLLVEMGTTGSVDGAGRLIIKGRFQSKQIEVLLKRYVVEYVTCVNCKSPNTTLIKDNRMTFLQCNNCGSKPSVGAIKSGFQAQIGRRKAMAS